MNLKQFIARRVFAWCLVLFLFTTLLIWPAQSQEQEKDAAQRKPTEPPAKLRDGDVWKTTNAGQVFIAQSQRRRQTRPAKARSTVAKKPTRSRTAKLTSPRSQTETERPESNEPRKQPNSAKWAPDVPGARRSEGFDQPDAAMRYLVQKRLPAGAKELPVERYITARQRMERMPHFSTALGRGWDSRATMLRAAVTPEQLGSWEFLGPGNIGGRTRSMVIHPTNPDVMYAAGVSGGILKTINGGGTWTPIADLIANISVGSLALDPSNPEVLYAGTGEGLFLGSPNGNNTTGFFRGLGIYKTTDGGATWVRLEQTANPNFYYVNDIVISPTNSQRIYAATEAGIFRSADGGATWTQALNPIVAGVPIPGGCHDLVIRTDQNNDYLFAACGLFTQGQIYRNPSANAGGGGAWTMVHSEARMGRTRLALAPSNQNIIYAVSEDALATAPFAFALHAVFRSTNSGEPGTWEARVRNTDPGKTNRAILSIPNSAFATDCGFTTTDNFSGITYHALAIGVDPLDANRVWVGSVEIYRSDDGGANWGLAGPSLFADRVGGRARLGPIHPDFHGMYFHPRYDGANNQTLFVATDGGVYRTDNARAAVGTNSTATCNPASIAVRWTALNNNFGLTQFYHGVPLPDGSGWFGGTQDNGNVLGTASGGANNWRNTSPGDGSVGAVDFLNPNTLYQQTQFRAIRKSTNGGAAFSLVSFGINPSDPAAFINPLALDPSDPQRLWTSGNLLWRTDNGAGLWTQASAPTAGMFSISALAVAQTDSNFVLAGRPDGTILRTNVGLTADANTVWASAQPRGGWVSWLAFDPTNHNIAYATYSQFGGGAKIWRSVDAGANWTPLNGTDAGALPDIPVHCIVLDPANTARMYIGTDLGVFASNDGGASWAVENTGFANVFTETLALQVENGVTRLYAFTHGRGAWRVTVNQTGCNYGLAQTGRSIAAAGETNTVNVTAKPGGCNWKTDSNAAWINISGGGSGDGAASYTVAPNPSTSARTGTVTIAGRTFVVRQAGQLDQTAPIVRITNPNSPTITTTQTTLNLTGTLTDNGVVSAVTWTNDRGRNGTANGTSNWTISALPLFTGVNNITVGATDAAGNLGLARLTINVTATGDTTPPEIAITAPTASPTLTFNGGAFTLGGTATDNTGIAQILWRNDRGGSGTASGTTNWTINNLPLLQGLNNLTVTVWDAAGNSRSATLAVTANPARVIVTAVGTGQPGLSGENVPATTAEIYSPVSVAADAAGNLFFTDTSNNRVRKVAPNGLVTTVAGSGTIGYSGDGGPATAATLNTPQGLAVDAAGNLYIAETPSHVIRKVTPNGTISTIAGTGVPGFSGDDGPATAAELTNPFGLALDAAGNLYVADRGNQRVRKVNAGDGRINTIAGNGFFGFSGDGGPATAARLLGPVGVAVDGAGNVYIVELNNRRIRKVNAGDGVITTIAGTGALGSGGDGGPATAAQFNAPIGLAFDAAGDLYVAELNGHRIRKITLGTGVISTFAGSGTPGARGDGGDPLAAQLAFPAGLAFDRAGNFYIGDQGNERVRKIVSAMALNTVAGVSAASFAGPAVASESIVALFGAKLANATQVAASLPLPTSLAGTSVKVLDAAGVERFAPLFFVSPTQINFLMPQGSAPGLATATVTSSDGTLSLGAIQVADVAPGLFTRLANGAGAPAAVASTDGGATFPIQLSNADGTPVEIQAGNIVVLFGTGLRFHTGAVTAAAGGVTSSPLFVGAQGGFAGLDQINWIVPPELAGKGELDLTFTLDGKTTNPVKIKVR